MVVSSHETAIGLARQGMGAVLVMRQSVEEDLRSGRLAVVADDLEYGSVVLEIIFRDRFPRAEAVAFANHVLDQDT